MAKILIQDVVQPGIEDVVQPGIEKEPENGFTRLSEGFVAGRHMNGSQYPYEGEICALFTERMDERHD